MPTLDFSSRCGAEALEVVITCKSVRELLAQGGAGMRALTASMASLGGGDGRAGGGCTNLGNELSMGAGGREVPVRLLERLRTQHSMLQAVVEAAATGKGTAGSW